MQEFHLDGEDHIKLCDLLSLTGLCPNAGVDKNIIATGVVKVDRQIEVRKRAKITKNQIVEYQNKEIKVV